MLQCTTVISAELVCYCNYRTRARAHTRKGNRAMRGAKAQARESQHPRAQTTNKNTPKSYMKIMEIRQRAQLTIQFTEYCEAKRILFVAAAVPGSSNLSQKTMPAAPIQKLNVSQSWRDTPWVNVPPNVSPPIRGQQFHFGNLIVTSQGGIKFTAL